MNINSDTQIALIEAYWKDTENWNTGARITYVSEGNPMYWEVTFSTCCGIKKEKVYVSDLLCWLFLRGEKG